MYCTNLVRLTCFLQVVTKVSSPVVIRPCYLVLCKADCTVCNMWHTPCIGAGLVGHLCILLQDNVLDAALRQKNASCSPSWCGDPMHCAKEANTSDPWLLGGQILKYTLGFSTELQWKYVFHVVSMQVT